MVRLFSALLEIVLSFQLIHQVAVNIMSTVTEKRRFHKLDVGEKVGEYQKTNHYVVYSSPVVER